MRPRALVALYLSSACALRLPSARAPCRRRAPAPRLAAEEDVQVRLATLQCPMGLSAAALSDALMEAGAYYVTLSDGSAGTEAEQPIFAAHPPGSAAPELTTTALESWGELLDARRLWSNATLEVGFPPSTDVQRALLSVIADAGTPLDYRLDEIAPTDWVSEVQSNWRPISLGGCLTIRFPWHGDEDVRAAQRAANADGAEAGPVLTLQPGLAFGTGEHATTQLCCLALRDLLASGSPLAGCTVLDYGSGSGILSFAALRFGASRAVGVEIDVDAITSSLANAALNPLSGDEAVGAGEAGAGLDARFCAEEPEAEAARAQVYPLVVANILAGTLVELAETLSERVAPGGTFLCSGVWGEAQVGRVIDAYAGRGFGEFSVRYAEGEAGAEAGAEAGGRGGWALLCAQKEMA